MFDCDVDCGCYVSGASDWGLCAHVCSFDRQSTRRHFICSAARTQPCPAPPSFPAPPPPLPRPLSQPSTNHHPLAEPQRQQEQQQRHQNAVSFPFSVSFPVRPKLPLFPQFSTSRPTALYPSPAPLLVRNRPESACQSKTESKRQAVTAAPSFSTEDPSLGPLSGHFDLCAFHFVVQYSYASRDVRLYGCFCMPMCVC